MNPMILHNSTTDIFVPDGKPANDALARVTHLGVGAHQDDLEFMAFHGIAQCYRHSDLSFGGVTCTNGGGSPRSGRYAQCTDEQMQAIRHEEQRTAAIMGRYGVMVQLNYPSKIVKDPADRSLREDLKQLLTAMHPRIVYTHNLADKHDTHIAVALAVISALRELPPSQHPQKLYGCEVWRALDWLLDQDKAMMDVSGHDNLATSLSGVFDSQIAGGKRYDLATMGRRRANATFFESHATDKSTDLIFGMDLTPLIADKSLDIIQFVGGLVDRFKSEVSKKLADRL